MTETQEKPKQEASRFPRKRFWGCMGFLAFACFGICGWMILLPSFFGQIPQSPLSPEFIPTAEALLTAPQHSSASDEYHFYMELLENFSDSEDAVCIHGGYSDEAKNDAIHNNSNLYIDGVWIFGASNVYVGYLTGLSGSVTWCASGELEAGLHLIEIHLKDSFFGDPIHIQQWAIRIGE